MTQQHPITPPPELLEQWVHFPADWHTVALLIAQWGADQELEACCAQISQCHLLMAEQRIVISQYLYACRRPEPPSPKKQALVALHGIAVKTEKLRAARRPKPPSLKEQALEAMHRNWNPHNNDDFDTIRRALEQLDD
jgi:hypothetical protein